MLGVFVKGLNTFKLKINTKRRTTINVDDMILLHHILQFLNKICSYLLFSAVCP